MFPLICKSNDEKLSFDGVRGNLSEVDNDPLGFEELGCCEGWDFGKL
jgi:hypothetical protein